MNDQASIEAHAMSERAARSPRSLIAHICFWGVGCLVIAGISKIAPSALFFWGASPVPIRANPYLLSVGIVLAPISLLLLYFSERCSSKISFFLRLGSLCTMISSMGAIIISLSPGSGSLLARDLVQQPEIRSNASVFAFPVFFRNGKMELTKEELRRLEDAFGVFRSCESGTLRVRGFASSKEYLTNSDALNLKLANDRAYSVKRALDKVVGGNVIVFEWVKFEDMTGSRRLRDTTPDGKLISRIEGYNRRAEVFWSDSICIGIGQQLISHPGEKALENSMESGK